jgi:hypothetical protein
MSHPGHHLDFMIVSRNQTCCKPQHEIQEEEGQTEEGEGQQEEGDSSAGQSVNTEEAVAT